MGRAAAGSMFAVWTNRVGIRRVRGNRGSVTLGRIALGTVLGIAIGLAPRPGEAQTVDLSGVTSETDGDAKIRIPDVVRCVNDVFELDFTFGAGTPTFSAQDSRNNVFSGTYVQKDPDGRKLVFTLDAPSLDLLEQEYIRYQTFCTGICDIVSSPDSIKLKGKVNEDLDKLKIKMKTNGKSLACGMPVKARYRWKTKGDLVLP